MACSQKRDDDGFKHDFETGHFHHRVSKHTPTTFLEKQSIERLEAAPNASRAMEHNVHFNPNEAASWFSNMDKARGRVTPYFVDSTVRYLPYGIMRRYSLQESSASETFSLSEMKPYDKEKMIKTFLGKVSDSNFIKFEFLGAGSYGAVYKVSSESDKTIPSVAVKFIQDADSQDAVTELKVLKHITRIATTDKYPHLPGLIRYSEFGGSLFLFVPVARNSVSGELSSNKLSIPQCASLIVQVMFAIYFLHLALPNDRFCDAHLGNFLIFRTSEKEPSDEYTTYVLPDGSSHDIIQDLYVVSWDYGLVNHCKQREFSAYDYFRSLSRHAGFLRDKHNVHPVLHKHLRSLLYHSYVLANGELPESEFHAMNAGSVPDWKQIPGTMVKKIHTRGTDDAHRVAALMFSDKDFLAILKYAEPVYERRTKRANTFYMNIAPHATSSSSTIATG